jgi:hypothetical protein
MLIAYNRHLRSRIQLILLKAKEMQAKHVDECLQSIWTIRSTTGLKSASVTVNSLTGWLFYIWRAIIAWRHMLLLPTRCAYTQCGSLCSSSSKRTLLRCSIRGQLWMLMSMYDSSKAWFFACLPCRFSFARSLAILEFPCRLSSKRFVEAALWRLGILHSYASVETLMISS